jgi:SAM-dependent methyltransferase
MSSPTPHSSIYLTNDLRDRWWNADYLDLVAKRLELAQVTSLLDVGCGMGHWGRTWYPRLAPGASLVGIDLEPRWVQGSHERFAHVYPAATGRARFLQGSATALPFSDGEFDAVTCQTVLIHVADADRAIAEMIRVVRPGGLIFCAEPNNFYNYARWNDAFATRPAEEIGCLHTFWTYCLRGRKALGSGDETIGDQLPAIFSRAGLSAVRAQQTDCMLSFTPPYSEFEQSYLAWMKAIRAKGEAVWDEQKMRKRVLAGGGDDAFFDKAFALLRVWADDDEERIQAGQYSAGGSLAHYLVSGRKPAEKEAAGGAATELSSGSALVAG